MTGVISSNKVVMVRKLCIKRYLYSAIKPVELWILSTKNAIIVAISILLDMWLKICREPKCILVIRINYFNFAYIYPLAKSNWNIIECFFHFLVIFKVMSFMHKKIRIVTAKILSRFRIISKLCHCIQLWFILQPLSSDILSWEKYEEKSALQKISFVYSPSSSLHL